MAHGIRMMAGGSDGAQVLSIMEIWFGYHMGFG